MFGISPGVNGAICASLGFTFIEFGAILNVLGSNAAWSSATHAGTARIANPYVVKNSVRFIVKSSAKTITACPTAYGEPDFFSQGNEKKGGTS